MKTRTIELSEATIELLSQLQSRLQEMCDSPITVTNDDVTRLVLKAFRNQLDSGQKLTFNIGKWEWYDLY